MNHSNLKPRPWVLSEVAYQDLKTTSYSVAVLPLGATEPHNLHLPYGTDWYEAQWLGELVCRKAWELGGKVVMLPAIPYGTETNMRNFPFAMNLQPSTLTAILRDLVESLELSGIRKLVLLNSHGGNDFKPVLRELYGKTSVHIFLCDWFRMVADRGPEIFTHKDDHAGEMETSLVLAYAPELVRRTDDGKLDADDGATRPLRFEALRRGWVGLTRPWHLLTTNSGSGNPHLATAEKGHRVAEVVAERLVPFLVELADAPLDDQFPFE